MKLRHGNNSFFVKDELNRLMFFLYTVLKLWGSKLYGLHGILSKHEDQLICSVMCFESKELQVLLCLSPTRGSLPLHVVRELSFLFAWSFIHNQTLQQEVRPSHPASAGRRCALPSSPCLIAGLSWSATSVYVSYASVSLMRQADYCI